MTFPFLGGAQHMASRHITPMSILIFNIVLPKNSISHQGCTQYSSKDLFLGVLLVVPPGAGEKPNKAS